MPRLHSTLSVPRRSKQTMMRRMDDQMDGQMDEMMLHDVLYYV